MHALHRYLNDCQTKRRRMRDRPSDEVLEELRRLLDAFESIQPSKPDDEPSGELVRA